MFKTESFQPQQNWKFSTSTKLFILYPYSRMNKWKSNVLNNLHYLFTIYTDSAWRHVSDKLLACIDRVGSCNVMVSGTESGC